MGDVDATTVIGIVALVVVVALAGWFLSLSFVKIQTAEVMVISVTYDSWRGATFIQTGGDYPDFAFRGMHPEIKAGHIYRFTYVRGVPWSRLVSVEDLGKILQQEG